MKLSILRTGMCALGSIIALTILTGNAYTAPSEDEMNARLAKFSSIELVDTGLLWDGGSIQLTFVSRPTEDRFSIVILNPKKSKLSSTVEPSIVLLGIEHKRHDNGYLIERNSQLEERLVRILSESKGLKENQTSAAQAQNYDAILHLLKTREGDWTSVSRRFITFDWTAFEKRVKDHN